jgi:fructosamine-3-kinase
MSAADSQQLEVAVERALGSRVVSNARVHGGDASEAHHMALDDGREVFVKTGARVTADVVTAEAYGLAWVAEARALRTPSVLAVLEAPAALVLEWIAPGAPARRAEEALGRGLAALHRASPAAFGLDRPGFLAGIPWDNAPRDDWATFYGEQRLVPLAARAVEMGRASPALARRVESLAARLPDLVGEDEPPARLHGDLWAGNQLWDASGAPVLVDPAAYGGHREVDLAMMRLFGGFSATTFDAYAEAHPLAPGHADRVGLYQLLPLLAHVVLFGGSYVASVDRELRALGA